MGLRLFESHRLPAARSERDRMHGVYRLWIWDLYCRDGGWFLLVRDGALQPGWLHLRGRQLGHEV